MTEIKNLFDEDPLLSNLKGASYFILLYERFEDSVSSTFCNMRYRTEETDTHKYRIIGDSREVTL